MKHLLLASLCLLLTLIFWQSPAFAKTHVPAPLAEGDIKGLVMDSQESRITGAMVTLQNKKYRFETQSNDEGAFQLRLPAGEYQLTIESNGFKVYTRKRVRIEADKTETISVTMWQSNPGGSIKVK